MFYTHNVLYFGTDLDIRLTPKNCSSTLKMLYCFSKGLRVQQADFANPHGLWPAPEAERSHRQKRIKGNNGEIFRPDSVRVAIKRDPVDRWLSVLNFSYQMREYVKYYISKGKSFNADLMQYTELPYLDIGINHAVEYHREVQYLCSESISQHFCAGHVDDYDYVFDVKNFGDCIDLIEKHCGNFHYLERQVRATAMTKDQKRFDKNMLTKKSIETIMEDIYKDDYNNGWY